LVGSPDSDASRRDLTKWVILNIIDGDVDNVCNVIMWPIIVQDMKVNGPSLVHMLRHVNKIDISLALIRGDIFSGFSGAWFI
jgi:hypothetical protein